jgi:hypothetical protein
MRALMKKQRLDLLQRWLVPVALLGGLLVASSNLPELIADWVMR